MSLNPEEKRFYLGLAIFGTFAGSGLFVVFEHGFWGWAFIIVGLIGLAYAVWEKFGAHVPARSTRLWVSALVLTWALIGFDFYERQYGYGYNPDRVWDDNAPLKQVVNRKFQNETVQLDGNRYVNCTFDHVTFVFRGVGRFDFVDSGFIYENATGRSNSSMASKNLVVNLSWILFNNMFMPGKRLPKEILHGSAYDSKYAK